jgi:hypothetical protein
MWVNLSKNEIETITAALDSHATMISSVSSLGRQKYDDLAKRLASDMADRLHPANPGWVEAAKQLHQQDGEVEVDEQNDGSALVSPCDDGSAYVMAWVFVHGDEYFEETSNG